MNINARCLILLLSCCNTVNAVVPSPSTQVIAAAELSGLFHSAVGLEDSGVYFDMLQQILNETELNNSIEILVMPMKRAKKGFLNKKFACYSPGLGTFDSQTELNLLHDVLVSSPLNKAVVRVVSARNNHLVSGGHDIGRNDMISMVRGTPLSVQMRQMAEQARELTFVNSELENIRMLQTGKVNHLFIFYPDVLFAYKTLGITEHYPYAKNFAPLVIDDTLICHKEYASTFKVLNEKIDQYRRDGTLKRLLGDFYMIDSLYMDQNPK